MANYAVGYTFTLEDIFYNFKSSKLIIDCISLTRLYNEPHKLVLAKRVFKDCCKLVLNDVIENDVEFLLPTGSRKSSIMMLMYDKQLFKKARKNGAFKDVDFLSSMFAAYRPMLYMYGYNSVRRTKPIYLDTLHKNRITELTNCGKTYAGKTVKTIKDYYERILLLYPRIPLKDLIKILNFGWKSLYLHNSYGGDTLVCDNSLWFYIGNLYTNSLYHFNYYVRKLAVKLRVTSRKKQIPWNGYYYFALTDALYNDYINSKHKRGRPRKNFKYGKVILYKLLDECKVLAHSLKYIFRVPMICDFGFMIMQTNFSSSLAELIIERDPQKLSDILVSNNDYEFL